MDIRLVFRQSLSYARKGMGFGGTLLKHTLVPLSLIKRVLPERGLVLDLGCGEGMLGNLVARRCPGLLIRGVDRNEEKIALANRNAPPNARFETGDILDQSFHGAYGAIFNDVLHHNPLPIQLELLEKAAKFMDDDGVLIIKEVDTLDSIDRRWTSFCDGKLYPEDNLCFRSLPEWKTVLFDAGFQVLMVKRIRHPWPASRTVLVCRRCKRSTIHQQPLSVGKTSENPVRVLITGGTGFIGRHLARHLLDNGLNGRSADVVILTRDRTRIPEDLDGHCRFIIGDIESLPSKPEILDGLDYVFHLAADKDFFGGRKVFINNIKGTQALLQALQGSSSLKRLVFASSMGAIDRPPNDDCSLPLNENSLAHPTSPYGRAKFQCERTISQSSLPFTILRLPWCYGPGMTSITHVRALTEMVKRRKLVTCFDWPGRVSLLGVDECARAFCFVATDPRTIRQILFVSDGSPIRFGSLFKEIGKTIGCQAGNIPIPSPVRWLARVFRRILPLSLRSLFLDVLWVDDRKLRELSFNAASRSEHFLLPLARFVNREANPSAHRSVALVTGAASGIGYALCVQLAANSKGVIMVDKDPRIIELAARIPNAVPLVTDLGDSHCMAKLHDLIQSGAVNWVVNCAGIGVLADVGTSNQNSLSLMLEVNIQALTRLSEVAIRSFRQAGEGLLVNIASSAALQPLPKMAAYAASKAYVLYFSEALAEEQKAYPGIGVITVCPSGVATNFQSTAGVRKPHGERLLSSDKVATVVLSSGLRHRSSTIFIGLRTFQMALLARLLPRAINVRLWKYLMDAYR